MRLEYASGRTLNWGTMASSPTGLGPDDANDVTLRRASADDAAALALVGGATFLEAFTWMLPGSDIVEFCAAQHTPELYARYLGRDTTRITVATVGFDVPVGYAMVVAPDLPTITPEPGDVELKRFYLLSRFRAATVDGVRASQSLMDAAIADARSLGGQRLLLGVNAGNEPALRFYARNGFSTVGTRTFQVGAQQCTDLILGRPL